MKRLTNHKNGFAQPPVVFSQNFMWIVGSSVHTCTYLYRGKVRLPLAGGGGLKVGLVADVPVSHPHSHYHYLLQLEWK